MLLACVAVLAQHNASPVLLKDTDTSVLLQALDERHSPLSWFGGDWPLQNHFYRPVSTLVFEIDHRLYGFGASGFGWTNALLCTFCVAALFWFVREVFDDRWLATGSAALFACWILDLGFYLAVCASWAAIPVGIVGFARHGFKFGRWVWAVCALAYLSSELMGLHPLWYRMMGWLPGRTASVMTVFGLASLACYARFERLGAQRKPAPGPNPLDPPATKSFSPDPEPSARVWGWAAASVVALLLALGSYEQAVMLPAALVGVAVVMHWRRYRVRWLWHVAFWGCLVAYLAIRKAVVPTAPSGYQLQQYRHSWSILRGIVEYLLPAANGIPGFIAALDMGPAIVFAKAGFIWEFATNVAAVVAMRRVWIPAIAGIGLSAIVYLPMAWFKDFDHYHFLPMALRTVMVVALARFAGGLALTALSPPPIQAPPRPSPAPGSLPRP